MAEDGSMAFEAMNADDRAFDEAVGATVRKVREAKRISQTMLGAAVGISFQQIQKYERGSNRISCSALRRIADCLGCTMSELLGESDPPAAIRDRALATDIISALKAHGQL